MHAKKLDKRHHQVDKCNDRHIALPFDKSIRRFIFQETRLVAANFDHTIGVKTPEVSQETSDIVTVASFHK